MSNEGGSTERESEGQPDERGATARLMDGSVFVKGPNRKPASDKHNILLLIFPASNGSTEWLTTARYGNSSLALDQYGRGKFHFSQRVSRRGDGARQVQIKHAE